MIKNSLVFKIFTRFIKEKNLFYSFKKTINNTYFNDLDNNLTVNHCSLTSFIVFSGLDNYHKYKTYFDFFAKKKNIEEFTNIVKYYTKKFIYQFLEDEKIKRKFITNLYTLNYSYNATIKNFKVNKHGDKLIDKYIDALLINNNLLASNFFFSSFNWNDTPQGYEYWLNINKKYKIFMSEKLLNKKII